MLERTEGIVLRTFPYGEADLLVTYLTRDLGLRKAFAKSPRKIKSRFGSSLEPFTCARVAFFGREDAALPRLTQSDIVRPFQGVRESLSSMLMLSAMAELTINFLREGVRSAEAFVLFREVLEMMEKEPRRLYPILYRVRFLGLKGYLPSLRGCAKCGREASSFYPSQGSVMCGPCASRAGLRAEGDGAMPVGAGAVRLFEALRDWDMRKVKRIKASDAMAAELEGIITAHVQYLLSRPMRTASFPP